MEEKYLSFEQAKEIVKNLARGQGFYGRLLESMNNFDDEQIEQFTEDLKCNKVKDTMDLIIYFEC